MSAYNSCADVALKQRTGTCTSIDFGHDEPAGQVGTSSCLFLHFSRRLTKATTSYFPFFRLGVSKKIEQLMRCEPIAEPAVKQLCLKARELLIEEGNVQHVDSPVTVREIILGKLRPDISPEAMTVYLG